MYMRRDKCIVLYVRVHIILVIYDNKLLLRSIFSKPKSSFSKAFTIIRFCCFIDVVMINSPLVAEGRKLFSSCRGSRELQPPKLSNVPACFVGCVMLY